MRALSRNAHFSIRDNRESQSNVTEVSDLQKEKHASKSPSTDEGREMDVMALPRNAHFSIRDNFESHSNVTDVSDVHDEKHASQRTSTDEGR
jgi:hypothetical protein